VTGLLLPQTLTDSDDDYVEELRGYLYPKLHPHLVKYTPAYAIGGVGPNQYAGKVRVDEETLEEELVELGFVRNPLACYKSTGDGRQSEGSWVLIAERDEYGVLDGEHRQLHVTLFQRRDGATGREIYAHVEDDWRDRPMAHLRGKAFSAQKGVADVQTVLNDHSYITLEDA
jgi:hypothetical protein